MLVKEFRERTSHTGQSGKRSFLEGRGLGVSLVEYVELGQTEGRETIMDNYFWVIMAVVVAACGYGIYKLKKICHR